MRKLVIHVVSWLFFLLMPMLAPTALAKPLDFGPTLGEKIPSNFSANDAEGVSKKYVDISGKNGTVLLFVRSAKWCPFCQAQMVDIKNIKGQLQTLGYNLVALSYDPPEVLARFAKGKNINYLLLSDTKSEMIDAFKLREAKYAPGHFAHGVPKPAIVVIDSQSVVRAVLAEEDYKARPTSAVIMQTIEGLKIN